MLISLGLNNYEKLSNSTPTNKSEILMTSINQWEKNSIAESETGP